MNGKVFLHELLGESDVKIEHLNTSTADYRVAMILG